MPVSTKNIKQFPGVRTFIFKALALRAIARADLCRLGLWAAGMLAINAVHHEESRTATITVKPPNTESRQNLQRLVCIKSHS